MLHCKNNARKVYHIQYVPKLQKKHRFTAALTIMCLFMITAAPQTGFSQSSAAPDSVLARRDSLLTLRTDTITLPGTGKEQKSVIDDIIKYASADSITFDIKEKLAYLTGDAHIEYGDIKIDAYRFVINFNNSSIFAEGITDSTGKEKGIPVFKQGNLNFTSKTLNYNFESKKGIIQNIVTREGEGYLQSNTVKKLADGSTNSKQGWYTTCDNTDHPHFAIKYSKARIIPNDKIVTGPAYLSIEDVPLPIALPFGIFPSKKGRSSGILIPKYGESANRGFFLENGGYYFGLNDYFDLKLVGDIYSRGSWAVKPTLTYKKRYKFSGSFNLNYAINKLGVKGASDYSKNNDFFVTWTHNQDSKANPNGVFSASVRAGSSKYNKYNPGTVNDYLTNTFASSVSYTRKLGTIGNMTASARHSQNTSQKTVSLSLPEVSLSLNRFYPFKRKQATGPAKWYESITVTYSMNARNDLNTADSLLFTKKSLDNFMMGMKHSIPMQGSFKVLKYLTWSNGISYTERWYAKTIQKTWIGDTTVVGEDTLAPHVLTDTISGFKAARDYSFNSSLSTTLYGMVQFGKKSPIRAIRHVVRPSIGFGYVPDFTTQKLGYYRLVQKDQAGKQELYSIFGTSSFSPFGTPPQGKSGSVNFSLGNNLEMKIRSKKDTITGTSKVMLIDNLNFSTSYDLARDSLRWSNLNISGRTTLFKKIQVNYGSSWSPYAVDTAGIAYNKFEWEVNHKLFRFENTSWALSVGYDFKSTDKKKKGKPPVQQPIQDDSGELEYIRNNPNEYLDWDNPWNLRVNYTFRYTGAISDRYTGEKKKTLVQTLDFNGDISITSKWKFTLRSGYDFKNKDFSLTQVSIYRNLHCWEMSFNWIPYGAQKSWSFAINARSAMLKDLKLTKKKDFRDNL